MKKELLLILFFTMILTLLPTKISYGESLNSEYLDIGLTRPRVQSNVINMQSNSGFSLYDSSDKGTILLSINEPVIMAILNNNGDISLTNSENNTLFTLPKDGSVLICSNTIENSTIIIEKNIYRDYIRLLNKNNEIIVINHIKIENYLYGLVPREMPSTFHMEALKAQAVASRTYALFNKNKHAIDGYSLCDTTHCQVYLGFDGEKATTNLAVDETKGILAYYDGKLIDAQYHSTSSGFTEDSANIWGGDLPYLKSVEDNFSTESPYSNWSLIISLSDLNNKLIASGINLGELKGIESLGITATGKVDKVKVIGTTGEQTITATQFRNIVGNTILKSAWFNIKNESINTSSNRVYVMNGNMLRPQIIDINKSYIVDAKNQKTVSRGTVNRVKGKDGVGSIGGYYPISTQEIIINGKGYGHGVGMSQYGAKKMAEQGYDFEQILKYYYTGIDISQK